jgi:hypothetical protein
MEPPKEGARGPYGRLSNRPLPEGRTTMFMPSLSALLTRARQLKGSPLAAARVRRPRSGSGATPR